jgi:hypothetical protein
MLDEKQEKLIEKNKSEDDDRRNTMERYNRKYLKGSLINEKDVIEMMMSSDSDSEYSKPTFL